MRLATVMTALALSGLLAACGDEPETRAAGEAPAAEAPTTASGGATSSGVDTAAPKGERIEKPLAPPQTSQSGAEDKPDPGDANDHSTPRHDARTKSSGD